MPKALWRSAKWATCSVVASAMLPGGGPALADPAQQLASAMREAQLAQASSDSDDAHRHLRYAMNCMVGRESGYYYAPQNDTGPCTDRDSVRDQMDPVNKGLARDIEMSLGRLHNKLTDAHDHAEDAIKDLSKLQAALGGGRGAAGSQTGADTAVTRAPPADRAPVRSELGSAGNARAIEAAGGDAAGPLRSGSYNCIAGFSTTLTLGEAIISGNSYRFVPPTNREITTGTYSASSGGITWSGDLGGVKHAQIHESHRQAGDPDAFWFSFLIPGATAPMTASCRHL